MLLNLLRPSVISSKKPEEYQNSTNQRREEYGYKNLRQKKNACRFLLGGNNAFYRIKGGKF